MIVNPGTMRFKGKFNPRTALWPLGTEPGLWISPRSTSVSYQDSAATTPLSAIGTVLDSSNPVGAILDRRFGATAIAKPGTHLLQATSTARPLASGRVNLLTKTEDFSDVVWGKTNLTVVQDAGLAPDGQNTLIKLNETAINSEHFTYYPYITALLNSSWQIIAKQGERSQIYIASNGGGATLFLVIDLTNGNVVSNSGSVIATNIVITSVSNGAYSIVFSYAPFSGSHQFTVGPALASVNVYQGVVGSGIYVWHPQISVVSVASPYQRVNTDSDYALSSLIYDKFDGVDDGWLSGTVAAGVIGNANMDCLIAVRRDTSANAVLGLYNAIADATKYFGMAESASGSLAVGAGAGTPTIWVDNVQLAGGTSVTRGTLHTALTVGTPHILEFRGLDLSTWTAAGCGLYTSYVLPGSFGGDGIMLFPATTAANRNKARTALAASVGLVL